MRETNATLRTLRAEAKRADVTVGVHRDKFGVSHEITLTAPPGRVFAGTGTHETVTRGDDGDTVDALVPLALADLRGGVEPCDDPACDWCHDGDESGVRA